MTTLHLHQFIFFPYIQLMWIHTNQPLHYFTDFKCHKPLLHGEEEEAGALRTSTMSLVIKKTRNGWMLFYDKELLPQ